MAMDMFIKIEGKDGVIKGETLDEKHPDEIPLLSWSTGASNQGSFEFGSGGGSGKVALSDLMVVKRMDKSSPILFMYCCTGEHLPKATLTVRKAGGKQEDYLQIVMEDLLISSVQQSGAAAGDDLPMETLTLNFAKVDVAYKPQNADGTLGAKITGNWDAKKGIAA